MEIHDVPDSRQTGSTGLEFWFDFASTYSYPTALRIEKLAKACDVTIIWRAFLLGPIFQSQGWSDSPFNIYPSKGRYMWRDLQRVCNEHRLEFHRPSRFPRNSVLAARIVCAFESTPWIADFIRQVFSANFVLDLDISDPDVLSDCLRLLGQDPETVMATATGPSAKSKLRISTSNAQKIGIFGAPSFVIGHEMYWGNEHLEKAIERARQTSP